MMRDIKTSIENERKHINSILESRKECVCGPVNGPYSYKYSRKVRFETSECGGMVHGISHKILIRFFSIYLSVAVGVCVCVKIMKICPEK